MTLLQDGVIALLAAVGLTAILWLLADMILRRREEVPVVLLLPLKDAAEEMEYQVYCLMEVRARTGRYTPIILVDCGLQEAARSRAEELTQTYTCVIMMRADELPRYLQ